ncbi:hypothetical protein OXX80_012699 [Metschnikowia pulcherrima]
MFSLSMTGQGCSCIDVAKMTPAGADDDAIMGKAESLIPSCVQQYLVSQLLIVYVCVSGTAHFYLAVEGLASFQRLSDDDGMSVDWLLEAAP